MAPSTTLLVAVGAVCVAEARTYNKPKYTQKMKQRTRPIKDEQTLRVDTLHSAMKDLRLDMLPNSVKELSTTYSTPDAESEAYYAYPLTLDYVVDLYFQNGTTGSMMEYPVIVDTGSSNLAVAVESCTNCESGSTGLELGWYDSSSADGVSTGETDDSGELCIDVTYGSGSWDGMMTDKVKVGFVDDATSLVDEVYLAGITSQDGFFCGGFYGILGLAYSGLTESYSTCTTSSSSQSGGGSSGRGSSRGGGSTSHGQTSGRGQSSGHMQPQQHQSGQTQTQQHQTTQHASPQAQPSAGRSQQGSQASHETQSRSSHTMPTASQGHGANVPSRDTQTRAATTPSAPSTHPRRTSAVSAEELEASATLTSTPLLDSFYEDGLVEDNVFSILFCGDLASMAVGGVDTTQVSSTDTQGLTFVDTQKTYDQIYGYFLVEVESVAVDGETVSTDSTDLNEIGGVLVDSGTTLIYLPSEVTSAIETKVESKVTSLETSFFQWSSCVAESELENFPDITLELNDYNLTLNPYQYLLWYSDCYYWGISSSSIPIIGNVALQGKLVVFDKANNQIGFSEGDCSDYGGTSFDTDDSSSSTKTTAKENAVPAGASGAGAEAEAEAEAEASDEGMGSEVLAAVQGTAEQMSGSMVAGAALVALGVAFVVARGRGKKYASVPEGEDDELSI